MRSMPIANAIMLLSASMQVDVQAVIAHAQAAGSRTILVAENGAEVGDDLARALDGVLFRNVPGVDLMDCIRRVGAGQRCVQHSNVTSILAQDTVGARVKDRLTPKEMQIVALIVQGCKNKQIASS